MRILLVDKAVCHADSPIRSCRMHLSQAESGEEGLSMMRHEKFDLVIVDTASLAEDGFAFIRRLRSAKDRTPLIALAGRLSSDRIRALSLGADDAVAKPIDRDELRARIGATVRRYRGHSESLMQIGDLHLLTDKREVRFKGLRLKLTAKEFSLLELLVSRNGQTITKDMFLNHLYGGEEEPDAKLIDVFICKLRRKLHAAGAEGLITTVCGHGYTIRAPKGMQPQTDPGGRCADRITLWSSATAKPFSGYLLSVWSGDDDDVRIRWAELPRRRIVH
jgi:two-component system, cell cycle response regulator CtrA